MYLFIGMNPRQVLDAYQTEMELRNDYDEIMRADAAVWPKANIIYKLYHQWRKHANIGPNSVISVAVSDCTDDTAYELDVASSNANEDCGANSTQFDELAETLISNLNSY